MLHEFELVILVLTHEFEVLHENMSKTEFCKLLRIQYSYAALSHFKTQTLFEC